MATLTTKSSVNQDADRAGYLESLSHFKQPNPGDIFLLVAFAWAAVCFAMVVSGQQLAQRAARLSGSQFVRDLALTDQSGIAALMIIGIIGIAACFYVFTHYRYFTMGLLFFSMTFANANWKLIHNFSFAIKYILLIYFGAYATLFIIKSGWRMMDRRGYRLVCLYVGWIAFIALLNGGRVGDLWYLGTEVALMIGFGVAWLSAIDNRDELERFCRMVGYVAIIATLFHMISPIVNPEYLMAGRFVSMYEWATGFATIYALLVVAMFWLAMYDKRVLWKRFFLLMATIGFLMILLSGTRNATVATLIGVGALWWVFRDRLLVYIGIMAVFGLLIQIIVGASETAALGDRLASTENQRLDVWIMYFGLALNSPFIGYGPDGLVPAIYGDSVAALISIAGRAYTPGVHNHYLGFAVRYGFIGLFIFLALLLMPIICAWKVVFSKVVSEADKKVYIMPAALLGIVILEGLFEDNVGSTGRGTLHGIALGFAVPLVLVYGRRLLNEAGTDQLERKK